MSTNNFAYENILVAIGQDYEEADWDLFQHVTIPEIQEQLALVLKDGRVDNGYLGDSLDRSYGGKKIYSVNVCTKADEVYKTIIVYWRSGYYAGANLDYMIEENYEAESAAEASALDRKVSILCNRIKRVLIKHGTELRKVAQFSNGEAMYEKVK